MKNRCAGFTLIEVIVALALLSVVAGMTWSYFSFADRQVSLRGKRAYEFDDAYALLEAISRNVRDSRATLLLDENQWIFLNRIGDTAMYRFTDGELKYNDLVLRCGRHTPSAFSFACGGRDTTLDRNGDGMVDMGELDENGNGSLEGAETKAVTWISATVALPSNAEKRFSITATMRNNCGYDGEERETYF